MEHIRRRSAPARRSRLSRSRAHRHSPGALRRRLESAARPKDDWMRLSHLVRTACRAAGRFSGAAFQHRSDGSHARADRRDGRLSATRSARTCTSRCKAAATACCARMRRRWGAQRFIDRCRLVQERLDRPAITTDIIVGFPGETDAEFARDDCHFAGCRLLEDSHLSVQPAARHAGGDDAEPGAEAGAAGAVPGVGERRRGTAYSVLRKADWPPAACVGGAGGARSERQGARRLVGHVLSVCDGRIRSQRRC